MSLGVVVKGPEGVVLAADTRVTLIAQKRDVNPPVVVNFDNATKLLTFGMCHEWVGAVTYGDALIGTRTAHSFMPEFQLKLGKERRSVSGYAQELSEFFLERWIAGNMPSEVPSGGGMSFIVGGYDEDQPYGAVFTFNIPTSPRAEQQNPNDFGMTWGGQLEIASRIVLGYDPRLLATLRERFNLSDSDLQALEDELGPSFGFSIPYEVLPLQDCVNLATFLIRTTISAQDLAVGVRGVGGTIEVATITRTDGLEWIQKKELHGEDHYGHSNRNS